MIEADAPQAFARRSPRSTKKGERIRFFRRHRRKTLFIIAVAAILGIDVGAANLKRLYVTSLIGADCRVESEVYHHGLRPNVDSFDQYGSYIYAIKTNSLGFKDRATRDISMKSGRHRILFIGDSFTEGVGLIYEDTFVGMIGAALESKDVEVLNAGVVSYCPLIYFRKTEFLIERVGLEFDELVVFIDISDAPDEANVFTLNDQGNVTLSHSESARWARIHGDPPGLTPREFVRRHTLLSYMALRFVRDAIAPEYATDIERGSWTYDEEAYHQIESGIAGMRQAMDRLLSLLRRHDIGLMVAVYPWPGQIARRDLNSKQVAIWSRWADDNNVTLLNCFPLFITDEPWEAVVRRNYIRGDFHFNKAGNRLIADHFLKSYSTGE